jgi:DNA polymerase elongation subunit (family B)
MVAEGYTYFKGMKVEDVSVLSFDIESDGLIQTKDSQVFCITNTFRRMGQVINKGFFLDEYGSQADMLTAWCDWVREVNPSIILGHNIYSYDFPYINHVSKLNGVELNLGRNGSALKFNTGK